MQRNAGQRQRRAFQEDPLGYEPLDTSAFECGQKPKGHSPSGPRKPKPMAMSVLQLILQCGIRAKEGAHPVFLILHRDRSPHGPGGDTL